MWNLVYLLRVRLSYQHCRASYLGYSFQMFLQYSFDSFPCFVQICKVGIQKEKNALKIEELQSTDLKWVQRNGLKRVS